MFFNINLLLFIFFCFLTCVSSKNCFWNSENAYKYFSSKTPYNSVRGDIRDSLVKLKACEPVSVWALIRHGKRTPSAYFGQNMKDSTIIKDHALHSYKKGNSELCAQDVQNLLDFHFDNEIFKKMHGLSEEGYMEMFEIGVRLKETFSKLLTDLEDGSYTIRSAYGDWVEDGVDGFVKGLSNKSLVVQSSNPRYDIMAPYENCSRYKQGVKNNSNTYKEANNYRATPEFIATKERIQRRIGIEYSLTDINITSLYDLCRYTWSGINNKASPWCALFTTQDLQVIEYYEDLRHYYRNGPGTSINEIFGQILLVDLYKTFLEFTNGSGKKMTTYFTHATMMDMTYSALGWFTDRNPLTSAYRDSYRRWRSSRMSAFAANLVAVLYKCLERDSENFKVMFYLNEKPVTFICERGVCSWQEFESMLKKFLNTSLDFCSEL